MYLLVHELYAAKTILILCHANPTFNDPEKEAFENIVEKGEHAGNQHFLLFQQCFLSFAKQIFIFKAHLFCNLQMLSISTRQNFLSG